MHVLVALLLLSIFITVPLAVNRGESRRVLFIALSLEVVKLILFFASLQFLLDAKSGIVSLIISVLTFIVMLPELAISYKYGARPLWGTALMFVSGAVWNLVPAYLISICLPKRRIDGETG